MSESGLSKGFGLSFGCLSGIAVFFLGIPVLMCGGCFMLAAIAPRPPERPETVAPAVVPAESGPAVSPTPAWASVKVGDLVAVNRGGGMSYVLVRYDDSDEFHRLMRANDAAGLLQMQKAGRIFPVFGGIRARVLETGILMARVRIDESGHAGKDGWVAPELLLPYGPIPDDGFSDEPPADSPTTEPEPAPSRPSPEPSPATPEVEVVPHPDFPPPSKTEALAASRLTLAKKLLGRSKASGRAALEKIVKEFPGTAAAKEASELLGE